MHKRTVATANLAVTLSLIGGTAVVMLQPGSGRAQSTMVSAEEAASSQRELEDSKRALAALQAQVDASPDLPQEIGLLMTRLRRSVMAEERTLQANDPGAARRQHDNTLLLLRRIGELLQRHLAAQADVAPQTTVDPQQLSQRLARLDARAQQLKLYAQSSGASVSFVQLDAARSQARQAVAQGDSERSKQALTQYYAELQKVEDVLLAVD